MIMRHAITKAIMLLVWGVVAAPAIQAAELIVFHSPDCGWCRVWEREVGIVFPRTAEARVLRLSRVDVADPLPSRLQNLKRVHYTPTFVVLDEGREIGRIAGYKGEEFFWWELQEIIQRLPSSKTHTATNMALKETSQ